jgi:DNA-binding response OmpR family regulator
MDVLIVDDEPQVREVHVKVLERAGFMVKAVDNGLAAFAELQQGSYSVVLCDIEMPFLEGKSLWDELQEHLPDVARRVVFVTGWADEERTRHFLERTGRPYLGKPTDLGELVNVVRRTMDAPAQTQREEHP